MEAVKLGSATVGLKNKTHAVLIALKRATSELSAHQKKIIPIDKHMGISISGLTADARILRYYLLTTYYFCLLVFVKSFYYIIYKVYNRKRSTLLIFLCYIYILLSHNLQ